MVYMMVNYSDFWASARSLIRPVSHVMSVKKMLNSVRILTNIKIGLSLCMPMENALQMLDTANLI